MNKRDDSMLFTGLTSASTRARTAKREETKAAKEREKVILSPSAKIVDDLIEEQLALAKNVETITISIDSTEETYKALLLARRMNIKFIKSFQSQLRNKLREKPEKRRSNDE